MSMRCGRALCRGTGSQTSAGSHHSPRRPACRSRLLLARRSLRQSGRRRRGVRYQRWLRRTVRRPAESEVACSRDSGGRSRPSPPPSQDSFLRTSPHLLLPLRRYRIHLPHPPTRHRKSQIRRRTVDRRQLPSPNLRGVKARAPLAAAWRPLPLRRHSHHLHHLGQRRRFRRPRRSILFRGRTEHRHRPAHRSPRDSARSSEPAVIGSVRVRLHQLPCMALNSAARSEALPNRRLRRP